MFDRHLAAWNLVADGEPVLTENSRLLPVRLQDGRAAMLKISVDPQERVGALLMKWWDGHGAARVFARSGDALLLERAKGTKSLVAMYRSGDDLEACRILCAVADRLRTARPGMPPGLTPLDARFADLSPAAATHGGILARCDAEARALLSEPRDVGILHGDLHHDNVLDFGDRGWLAIDPKGLVGERGFECANIFCTPDLSDAMQPVATEQDIFSARLALVAEAANIERSRLLLWILAWAGISAAWILHGGLPRTRRLRIFARKWLTMW